MSSGFGSYSCGSVPSGTKLYTSTCSPPIASTMSVMIENVDVIFNGSSVPSSAVSDEQPVKISNATKIPDNFLIKSISIKLLS